jgi:hypothetical protein
VRVLDEDQAAEMSRAFGILMAPPEEPVAVERPD